MKKMVVDGNELVERKKRKYNDGHWHLVSMLIPASVLVFIFSYIPMFGLIIAFKDYKYNLGFLNSPWNGFDNFVYIFKSNTFLTLVRNTIGYNVVIMILGIILNVFMALMLFTLISKWTIKIFQSSMFIPHFLSWVVVSYITHALLKTDSGAINVLLDSLGMEKISFYITPKYWPFILVIVSLWKGMGFSMLMYYGSMLSIDTQLYEAAELDGCGYVKKHYYVTLPHLTKTIIMLTLLGLGSMFRSDYGLYYQIPKDTGVLYPVTDVLDTYIMRAITISGSVGQASAVGFLQSIVGFILVMAANLTTKKIDSDSALF